MKALHEYYVKILCDDGETYEWEGSASNAEIAQVSAWAQALFLQKKPVEVEEYVRTS